MVRTILKAIAYTQAPRTTYAVLHPKSAVRLKKMGWDMRHSLAPRVAAIGAAAIALPLGIALSRTASRLSGAVRTARANGELDDGGPRRAARDPEAAQHGPRVRPVRERNRDAR